RAVGQAARHRHQQGDGARLDGSGRAMEGTIAQTRREAFLAATAERVRGVGAEGYVDSRLAGGRGDVRYLVRWIDDATSRSGGRFVLHDGTRENMGVLWQYVGCNGRMVDLYTDRAGIFTVAPRAKESAQRRQEADRLTQFDRGLREL